jgi:hypothetical protein
MVAKYVCDGCGNEAPQIQERTMALSTTGSLEVRPSSGRHLCSGCFAKALAVAAREARENAEFHGEQDHG